MKQDYISKAKYDEILANRNSLKAQYSAAELNYKDNKRTEVAIEYNINLKSTTNIPLEYKIFEKLENRPYYKLNIPGGGPNNTLGL